MDLDIQPAERVLEVVHESPAIIERIEASAASLEVLVRAVGERDHLLVTLAQQTDLGYQPRQKARGKGTTGKAEDVDLVCAARSVLRSNGGHEHGRRRTHLRACSISSRTCSRQ